MSNNSKQTAGRRRLVSDSGLTRIKTWAEQKAKAAEIESPEAICAELGISRTTLTNYLVELGFGVPKGGAA